MARQLTWIAGALACSWVLAGSVGAGTFPTNDTGFVMGDPSSGKLIPYYTFSSGKCDTNSNGKIDPIENVVANDCGTNAECPGGEACLPPEASGTATLIGFENTNLNVEAGVAPASAAIYVHLEVFDVESNPIFSKTMCLTQGDFGYVVLQEKDLTDAQKADKVTRCGPDSPHPNPDPTCKVTVLSQEVNGIPSQGYVTLAARLAGIDTTNEGDLESRTCAMGVDPESLSDTHALYAWAVIQDVSNGFFATEIPVPSAGVNYLTGSPFDNEPCGITAGKKSQDGDGSVPAGTACLFDTSVNGTGVYGLISGERRVGFRYDCNPENDSVSTAIIWSQNNLGLTLPIIARGEDEGCFDGSIPIPVEVNVIDACNLVPVRALTNSANEYRGAVEFMTPGTADVDGYFLFSLISQAGQHFVMTQLPYQTGQEPDDVVVACPGGL
jgi:hypothetical protein